MFRILIAAALSLAAAGCASSPNVLAPRPGLDTITVEAGVCCAGTSVYRLSVASDGRVGFVGEDKTRVRGARSGVIEVARYEALERALAPYKPPQALPECLSGVFHAQVFTVTWTDATGAASTLEYYAGGTCPASMEFNTILYGVPEITGLSDWIRSDR